MRCRRPLPSALLPLTRLKGCGAKAGGRAEDLKAPLDLPGVVRVQPPGHSRVHPLQFRKGGRYVLGAAPLSCQANGPLDYFELILWKPLSLLFQLPGKIAHRQVTQLGQRVGNPLLFMYLKMGDEFPMTNPFYFGTKIYNSGNVVSVQANPPSILK